MNKSLLMFGLFFACVCHTDAQPSTFFKMYNRGNSGFCVREQSANSYLVAGGTNFYYNYHWMQLSPPATTNIHLFKTSTQGDLIWEKVFSSPGFRSISRWMEPTSDGGSIITGYTNNETLWPPDSNNIVLLKVDGSGTLTWSKTFDTGKDELGYCVRQTSDGGYAISGFHDSSPVSLMGNTYALLLKTDSSGTLLWNKKYQLPVRDFDTGESFPVVFYQTSDNGYILISTTWGAHQADICIIRTNASGDLIWAKSYEHDNSSFRLGVGLDILENTSGEFIIAGSMDKNRTLSQYNYPFIMKLNAAGDLLTAKILGAVPDLMFQSGFSSVEQTLDGGYFFTGMGGYGGFGDQAQLLKTDSQLAMQWARVYTWDGVATMGARSARSTSDGSFIFTGKRQFSGTVVMKTNNIGLIPCKNPATMNEIIPSLTVVNHTPTVSSGINESVFPMFTQIFLTDTAVICPVTTSLLPVELMSFTAERLNEDKIRLKWISGSEIGLHGYSIEKKVGNRSFVEVGFVDGAGNTSTTKVYHYEDINTENNSDLFYRLRQVDVNGSFDYSSTLSVKATKDIKVVPSAFITDESGMLVLNLTQLNGQTVYVQFTNVLGQELYTCTQKIDDSNIHFQMKLPIIGLSEGIYCFSVSSKNTIIKNKYFHR